MRDRVPCVYVLASMRNGTLYIGVTSDLPRRMFEHRNGLIEGFTKRYDVKMLVYAEFFDAMQDAIAREKRLKEWRRAWKLRLIEGANPEWHDLYDEATGEIRDAPYDALRRRE